MSGLKRGCSVWTTIAVSWLPEQCSFAWKKEKKSLIFSLWTLTNYRKFYYYIRLSRFIFSLYFSSSGLCDSMIQIRKQNTIKRFLNSKMNLSCIIIVEGNNKSLQSNRPQIYYDFRKKSITSQKRRAAAPDFALWIFRIGGCIAAPERSWCQFRWSLKLMQKKYGK